MERKEAIGKGLVKYITGRECNRGHSGFRYTNTGACVDCIRIYNQGGDYVSVTERVHKDDEVMAREFLRVLRDSRLSRQ